jgi:hypothetical protein
MSFSNSEGRVALWPPNASTLDGAAVGIVRIANHGSSAVYNVAYKLKLHIGSQQGVGGVTDAVVDLPIFDLPTANSEAVFYFVDQSELGGIVELLTGAIGEVQGSTARQKIDLGVRVLTLFDKIPMFPPLIGYKWDQGKLINLRPRRVRAH